MSFENPGINGVQALLGKDDTMGLMEIQKKGRFIVLQSLALKLNRRESFGDKTLPSGKTAEESPAVSAGHRPGERRSFLGR